MHTGHRPISVYRLGTVPYEAACRLQERIAQARIRGTMADALLLLQHPPVITVGRAGGREDVLASESRLERTGVRLCETDRGGRATYHGPGQLVIYPILKLDEGDLYAYLQRLEAVTIRMLRTYGIRGGRLEGHPGVWVEGEKIAAIGLAVQDGVTRHGLALNVAPNMAHFDLLIPCGLPDRGVTSMERALGTAPDHQEVTVRLLQAFGEVFPRLIREGDVDALARFVDDGVEHPTWLWRRIAAGAEPAVESMGRLLDELSLRTVCQEALCPNLTECFSRGTATFMILGDVCTRGCRFCAVKRGQPEPIDPSEPERVAAAAARLGLRHLVVTAVTRDDLRDGGAAQFAATVEAVRRELPECPVELLVPDFGGSCSAMDLVLGARPDVLNHNLETVPRLYRGVRPGANYRRSLALLAYAKSRSPQVVTKSGLILGLGEGGAEVYRVLHDLRRARCDLVTLDQYLQPTARQLPVARYLSPEEFTGYEESGAELGFASVLAGPLVRSSYRAEAVFAHRPHDGGAGSCLRTGDHPRVDLVGLGTGIDSGPGAGQPPQTVRPGTPGTCG